MKKLMKNVAVILGLSLIAVTANANTSKVKAPSELCYWFNSQGVDGEWNEQLLVSKKKLTNKQAHAYMQKNHGMSDIYDIELLPNDECDSAVVSFGMGGDDMLFHYKEPKTTATKSQTKQQAQPVKKATTTK